jgi:uncharacterized membrane protein YfcA
MSPDQAFYLSIFLYLLAGAFGGFLAGMLGVGGGIVFIPVIQEIIRNKALTEESAFYVLANSVAVVLIVSISGTIKQYKMKNTNLKASAVTGLFAIISSLSLSLILKKYKINDPVLFNYIFAGILILTALRMWFSPKKKDEDKEELNMPPLKQFIPAGFFAGLITALTGLGGGVVLVPYFNKILKLPIKFATGMSLSVIPFIATPVLLFYMTESPTKEVFPGLQTGYVMWTAILPLVIAAGIASPYGVKTANKMSSKTLFNIFMFFIVITILKVLFL